MSTQKELDAAHALIGLGAMGFMFLLGLFIGWMLP